MAGERVFLDTSLIVAASVQEHPSHEVAAAYIDRQAAAHCQGRWTGLGRQLLMPKRPTRQGPEKPTAAAGVSRLLVLVENMQSQIRAVAEGVTVVDRRLSELERRIPADLGGQLATLGAAIRQNSTDIRRVENRLDGVEQKLGDVEKKLDGKADRAEVAKLAERISELGPS